MGVKHVHHVAVEGTGHLVNGVVCCPLPVTMVCWPIAVPARSISMPVMARIGTTPWICPCYAQPGAGRIPSRYRMSTSSISVSGMQPITGTTTMGITGGWK